MKKNQILPFIAKTDILENNKIDLKDNNNDQKYMWIFYGFLTIISLCILKSVWCAFNCCMDKILETKNQLISNDDTEYLGKQEIKFLAHHNILDNSIFHLSEKEEIFEKNFNEWHIDLSNTYEHEIDDVVFDRLLETDSEVEEHKVSSF